MTSPMRPVPVVAAVIVRDGAVLACRRAAHKDAAGRWEFPGGKVEAGETPQEALRRELSEELGVEVRVGALLERTATGGVELACYAVMLAGAAPTASTDHDALEWRATDDLDGLEWADADRPVVALLGRMGSAELAAAAEPAVAPPVEEETR